LRAISNVFRGGWITCTKQYFEQLPIPQVSFTTPTSERIRFVQDSQRYLQDADNSGYAKVVDLVEQHLKREPEQTDVVHDLLAYLAEQMIEMNRQKKSEVKDFLDWLETYTGRPLDQRQLKSSLPTYYEGGWDTFKRTLDRNARAISQVDVLGREPLGRIQREYHKSTAVLTPLLARLQATDNLIDEIVYRLYGLTAEAIAIVKGVSQPDQPLS
jgi:hypothetical protein